MDRMKEFAKKAGDSITSVVRDVGYHTKSVVEGVLNHPKETALSILTLYCLSGAPAMGADKKDYKAKSKTEDKKKVNGFIYGALGYDPLHTLNTKLGEISDGEKIPGFNGGPGAEMIYNTSGIGVGIGFNATFFKKVDTELKKYLQQENGKTGDAKVTMFNPYLVIEKKWGKNGYAFGLYMAPGAKIGVVNQEITSGKNAGKHSSTTGEFNLPLGIIIQLKNVQIKAAYVVPRNQVEVNTGITF